MSSLVQQWWEGLDKPEWRNFFVAMVALALYSTAAAETATATFNLQQEFGFGTPPGPRTVTAGQSAQFTIEVAGQPRFAGAVSFACTSGVPQGAACAFNPASVSPAGGAATTVLTVTTTSRTLAMSPQASVGVFACWLMPFGLLLASWRSRPQHRSCLALFAVLLLLVGTLVACGGGSEATSRPLAQTNPVGTPTDTSTIPC
ncbi:MAG: hypothetical protein M1451_02085, partial [Acidobacteria bacterium]|nr:hypothetical protein [Acidobacteriota bacterium]